MNGQAFYRLLMQGKNTFDIDLSVIYSEDKCVAFLLGFMQKEIIEFFKKYKDKELLKIFIFLFASFIALSCSSNKKQAISNTNDFNTKTTVDSFKYEELTVQFLNNWKLVENSNQDSNSKMLI